MFIAKKYSTFNEFIFFSEYSVLLNLILMVSQVVASLLIFKHIEMTALVENQKGNIAI